MFYLFHIVLHKNANGVLNVRLRICHYFTPLFGKITDGIRLLSNESTKL